MDNGFINRKDSIIASAIEIISEAGMASLTTETLARKENMSVSLLYRYFGSIEEVLVEVISAFTKFDQGMITTIEARDIPHIEKVLEFLRNLSVYYVGYREMSSIVLNYEVFLHNVSTREAVSACIDMRTSFIRGELDLAMEEGEIIDIFTSEELSNLLFGSLERDLLNRRVQNDGRTHSEIADTTLSKLVNLLYVKEDS